MEDISLHILDIAQNSIDAKASLIQIIINEDNEHSNLIIEIKDNGVGMDLNTIQKAKDPLGTTKGKKFGLGIPLFIQSAEESGGKVELISEQGKGTTIKAYFKTNSIDMKPLGDIAKTIIVIIGMHPEIDLYFKHIKDDDEFELDTKEVKKALDGIPINTPEVIGYIRKKINKWYNK